MIVYRYLTEEELELIKQGKTDEIGALYTRETYKKVNTHKYKVGVKYLHFFKDEKMINQIRYLHQGSSQNYYICKFNIPAIHLIFSVGLGHYKTSGLKTKKQTVLEFALEAQQLKPEWLVSYKFDEYKNIMKRLK